MHELLGYPGWLAGPLEIREVLARVLDGSRFSDFKPRYGTQLVCGWGSVHGFPVGVLANNPLRMDYYKKYQEIIADYNREKDRATVEATFAHVVALAAGLDAEQTAPGRSTPRPEKR